MVGIFNQPNFPVNYSSGVCFNHILQRVVKVKKIQNECTISIWNLCLNPIKLWIVCFLCNIYWNSLNFCSLLLVNSTLTVLSGGDIQYREGWTTHFSCEGSCYLLQFIQQLLYWSWKDSEGDVHICFTKFNKQFIIVLGSG